MEAKGALLKMDAAVLRLYDLPPRAERNVLKLFEGRQRLGVPFPFTRYYAEGFRPAIPLPLYISDEYSRTTAAAISARFLPGARVGPAGAGGKMRIESRPDRRGDVRRESAA